jgi:hypothetical protein
MTGAVVLFLMILSVQDLNAAVGFLAFRFPERSQASSLASSF